MEDCNSFNNDKITVSQTHKRFTYADLVRGLKRGKFKNILVLTGAGISLPAKVPDFRDPNSAIFKDLQ